MGGFWREPKVAWQRDDPLASGPLGLLHEVKYGVTLDHNQKKEWNPIFPEKL